MTGPVKTELSESYKKFYEIVDKMNYPLSRANLICIPHSTAVLTKILKNRTSKDREEKIAAVREFSKYIYSYPKSSGDNFDPENPPSGEYVTPHIVKSYADFDFKNMVMMSGEKKSIKTPFEIAKNPIGVNHNEKTIPLLILKLKGKTSGGYCNSVIDNEDIRVQIAKKTEHAFKIYRGTKHDRNPYDEIIAGIIAVLRSHNKTDVLKKIARKFSPCSMANFYWVVVQPCMDECEKNVPTEILEMIGLKTRNIGPCKPIIEDFMKEFCKKDRSKIEDMMVEETCISGKKVCSDFLDIYKKHGQTKEDLVIDYMIFKTMKIANRLECQKKGRASASEAKFLVRCIHFDASCGVKGLWKKCCPPSDHDESRLLCEPFEFSRSCCFLRDHCCSGDMDKMSCCQITAPNKAKDKKILSVLNA